MAKKTTDKTNNDLHNTTQKIKMWTTQTSTKNEVDSASSEVWAVITYDYLYGVPMMETIICS